MFGIPEWAIGVAAILGGVGVMSVIIQIGDAVKRGLIGAQHARESRGPQTVIGMSVGAHASDSGPQPEVLEDLQRRVAELEERVDFAERLLAKQREVERLIPPKR